jgi:MoxR-like ATPase
LLALQPQVWDVHVDETLESYIVQLVDATRRHPDLALGASPRASLALYKTAQALAVLRGRDHILPDDIKYLFEPALASPHHRASGSRVERQDHIRDPAGSAPGNPLKDLFVDRRVA